MKYRFFQILARDSTADAEALNAFLAARRIVAVDRQFVADGENSFWALSVTYVDGADGPGRADGQPQGRKAKVDYREVLDERDFATYAALRTLRKELAERDGVPAYALFTNEQLAAMVQRKVSSAADLAGIEGVGKARVEKFASAFLRVLTEHATSPDEGEGGRAPGTD